MRRARGALAALAVIAVAAGIPAGLLAVVGDPFPSSLPSWSQLHLAIASGNVADRTWVKVIALAVWAVWLRLVWVAASEGAAAWQARRARRAHEPQRSASPVAWLVATAVAGLWSVVPATPSFASASGPAPAATALAPARPAKSPPPAPGPAAAPRAATPGGLTYVVRRGDSLWDIAADHLGPGAGLQSIATHWKAIWALNRGRDMGGGVRFTDPSLIYAGWVLELPPSLAPARPQTPPGTKAASPPHPRAHLQEAAALTTVLPRGTPAALPRPHAVQRRATDEQAPDPAPAAAPLGPEIEIGAGLGLGLLAAGIAAELVRRRRHQLRSRRPGRRIRLPVGPEAETARRVAASSDVDGARWVDLGLRRLAAGLRTSGAATRAPAVVEVRLSPAEMVVLAAGPTLPAPPLEVEADSWRLARSDPAELARETDGAAPCPALVTLGRHLGPGADEVVLANLELYGLVAVEGPEEEVAAAVRAMAMELATAPWAECAEVVLVGLAPELAELERVRVAAGFDEVLGGLEQVALECEAALAEAGRSSPGVARIVDQEPCWAPTVVLTGPRQDPVDLDRLVALARRPGVVAVVGDRVEGAWTLRVDDGILVPPAPGEGGAVGPPLRAQLVSEADSCTVTRLLAGAATGAEVGPADPPYASMGPRPSAGVAAVEIQLLGPVALVGATVRSSWGKVLELLAYLACHPEGVATDVWETALWPDRRVAAGTRRNLLSYARRGLGTGTHGEPRLVNEAGRARLVGDVGSDWARFRDLAARGPDSWREALELVRGQPLGGLDAPWARVEGHLAAMEQEVLDLALSLSEREMGADNPRGAEWAARQGLAASPWDERLYRAWMRAASMAGNRTGVEAAWRQLTATLDAGDDPTLAVEPETVDLYRALARPIPRS